MSIDVTGIGSVADLAKNIINRFFPQKMSESERAKLQIELQGMLQERETKLLEVQKSILVAELQQGDAYTKRARPTVVYAGLAFIFLVHVLFPILSFYTRSEVPNLALPEAFWWAWSGVVGTWVVGRSFEKHGAQGKIINLITGGRK